MEEFREVLLFCMIYAGTLGAALAYTVRPGKVQRIPVPTPPTRRPETDIF